MAIRMLIADDHEVVRSGIKNLLEGTDIAIIGEATNGNEVVRMTAELKPDIVVLDVRMPDGDGLTTLGRLKLDYPNLPVLMLSTYDNPTYVARSVALGACGYLMKTASKEKLLGAIQSGAAGESVWTRDELRLSLIHI